MFSHQLILFFPSLTLPFFHLSADSALISLVYLWPNSFSPLFLFSQLNRLSSLPLPFFVILSVLWQRKTLLYQSQTSGDSYPLICCWYTLCCSSPAPHQPWLERWINQGIDTHANLQDRLDKVEEGRPNFSFSMSLSVCLANMHRHTLLTICSVTTSG